VPAKVKVKEFLLNDGIGSQVWRKLYAMSYAKHNGLVFEDTPITDFSIHESDNINNEKEKQELILKFSSLIYNPWKGLDFSEYELSKSVGAGVPESQGVIKDKEFMSSATDFNLIKEFDNSIVIHIRRGDVIKENPRWIDEDVYVNILKNIKEVIDKFDMNNPRVIVLTDAPDEDKVYKPINDYQKSLWNQPYLHEDENGGYITKSFNFDLLKKEYQNLEVINRLDTYDSFLLMLRAKVLFVSRSAFSQSAGLLSKNNVFEMFSSYNGFANSVGTVTESGDIVFYNKKP
jgi:hypothetical protein